jgi:hypothetical protein
MPSSAVVFCSGLITAVASAGWLAAFSGKPDMLMPPDLLPRAGEA